MVSKIKKFYSVTEVAAKLGVSRPYVLKLIKTGKLPAQKVGATYTIEAKELPGVYRPINEKDKREIRKGIERTFKEYGEVIKKLGET